MNREIKFRGKDLTNGMWYYGYYIKTKEESKIITDDGFVFIKPETIGQFTGLKDTNDKEIYEGDIVTSDTYPFVDGEGNRNYHGVVTWLEDGFVVETVRSVETTVRGISERNTERITDFLSRLPEVIGNIHDNKELLKKK